MTDKDKIGIHVDLSEQQVPEPSEDDRCPTHPEAIPEINYGLASGGIGVYSYCPICGKVLSKTQDRNEQ
jgi:hypothetical protein